jgi:DegV family protein with EDD domain
MNHYKIVSDFGCNFPEHLIKQYEIEIIPTNLHIEGEKNVRTDQIDISEFYQKLREKKMIKTSAINMQTFKDCFSKILENGDDVLYIGMSSGLSGTFGAAKLAAMELSEEYPERKVYCVDSRSGCGGIGLAVYLAALKREEGADTETAYAYISDICTRLQSWFSVDDLFFLKRGGRLSSSTAIVGSLFMIKPILTTDNEGKLFAWGKARGKKGVTEELLNRINELAFDPENSIFFISHCDAMEDAVQFDMKLRTKWDVKDSIITDISPAFGAHCGPGALAVFFVGKKPEENEKNEDTENTITES